MLESRLLGGGIDVRILQAMGNTTAAQVCCCERRPDPRRQYRRGDGETPLSPHLKGAKQESKSSSSSWPFDFESNEPGDLTKPLAEQAADQAEGKVKILESSALKVMGKLRKFPTSGMGWGSGWSAKERFFAVLPAKAYLKESRKSEKFEFVYEIDKAPGGSSPRGPRSIDRLRCWRSGSLQYWDTTAAFEKKEPSKGSIPLLGITRVYIDDQNKNEVIVKYANGASSEPVFLRLHFPSQMAAEQWRQEMRQVRATL